MALNSLSISPSINYLKSLAARVDNERRVVIDAPHDPKQNPKPWSMVRPAGVQPNIGIPKLPQIARDETEAEAEAELEAEIEAIDPKHARIGLPNLPCLQDRRLCSTLLPTTSPTFPRSSEMDESA